MNRMTAYSIDMLTADAVCLQSDCSGKYENIENIQKCVRQSYQEVANTDITVSNVLELLRLLI
jgi:predicted TIM-barrel enzyme